MLEIINHLNFTTIGLPGLTVTSCVFYSKSTEAAQAIGATKLPYEWLSNQAKVGESCFYWKMILDFKMRFHMYIKSIHEGNFDLYIESLSALIIMNKYIYARLLTVHIFELIAMDVKHPEVHKNLKKAFFPFRRQIKNFQELLLTKGTSKTAR